MIYISSSCFRENTLSEILIKSIKYDIYNIELSGGSRFTTGFADLLMEYKSAYHLNYLVHNYFPPPEDPFVLNIAAADNDLREKSVEFGKKSIELSAKIGGTVYSIHSGYLVDLRLSEDGDHFIQDNNGLNNELMAKENFVRSVDELCAYARKFNMNFGIENLFPLNSEQNFSLMCLSEEIKSAFDTFANHDNFGLLLDLGHAQLSANMLGFDLEQFLKGIVKDYRERILQIHISDNSGFTDQHILPHKDSWMDRFVFDFDLRDVPLTIEARSSNIDDIVAYYHYLQNKLRS